MFADGHEKQDAEVYSSSAFGGTEHGGKAEFSSHLHGFRCLLLCLRAFFYVAFDRFACVPSAVGAELRNARKSV